jgi:hypothetical protein
MKKESFFKQSRLLVHQKFIFNYCFLSNDNRLLFLMNIFIVILVENNI